MIINLFIGVKNAKNLKNTETFKNITLSFDKTPKQMEHYKQIRNELQNRLKDGEHVIIKYIHGVATIVKRTLN